MQCQSKPKLCSLYLLTLKSVSGVNFSLRLNWPSGTGKIEAEGEVKLNRGEVKSNPGRGKIEADGEVKLNPGQVNLNPGEVKLNPGRGIIEADGEVIN